MTQGRFRFAGRWKAVVAIAAAAVVAALLAPGTGRGGSEQAAAAAAVATAEPGPCLLPPAEMRRQHSRLLREERRMAVRYGKRNPGTSLGRCIACHAVFDAAGQPVAYDNERHFCRACHAKVAVAPDCFSCHRSTPPQARGTP